MKKVLSFMAPYRGEAALTLLLVLLQSMADLLLPNMMAKIVDVGVVNGDLGAIARTGSAMLAVALAGVAFAVLGAYYASKVSMSFGRDLRSKVFSRITGWSPADFETLGTATLITRTTNDVTQIQNLAMMALRMLARAPMMAIGSLALALSMDRRLSMILIFSLPLLAGTVVLVATKGMPLFRAIQKKLDGLNLVLREGLSGVRVVRAFDRDKLEQERFGVANDDLTATTLKAQRFMALMMPAMMIIMNLTSVAVVWFGGHQVEQGAIQVGDLMAFLQYVMHILFSMMMLSLMFVMYPRAAVSADRIAEVLSVDETVLDPEEPQRPAAGVRGSVEFRNVSFRYPGAEEYALKDVSFSAAAGETTAIIGGTGSGKSTMLALLARFYDVSSGAILVDGVDVRGQSQAELRARIGYVPQKAVLFTGSVADNMRYGKEDADADELRRAASIAQASDFIDGLDGTYGAQLTQGGSNLSGGQKQRLGIARALVRKPEIYAFDDSFSALDFKTDASLRRDLQKETDASTVLIVAQRVGTVMGADRIIVLDEGRIVGIGRHEELLETCAVYREIVESQLSTEASA